MPKHPSVFSFCSIITKGMGMCKTGNEGLRADGKMI